MSWTSVVVVVILVVLLNAIKILRDWERGVIMRRGHFQAVRGPGTIFVMPLIERMVRVDTRPFTIEVESEDIVTQDDVRLRVNTGVRCRISEPKEAVVNVEDFRAATSQKAEMVVRDVLGLYPFDALSTQLDPVTHQMQMVLESEIAPWGLTVESVDIKHVDRS